MKTQIDKEEPGVILHSVDLAKFNVCGVMHNKPL